MNEVLVCCERFIFICFADFCISQRRLVLSGQRQESVKNKGKMTVCQKSISICLPMFSFSSKSLEAEPVPDQLVSGLYVLSTAQGHFRTNKVRCVFFFLYT